jgi:hypothetical protein
MKRYLMPITFLFSLALSGFAFGKTLDSRLGVESSLEARVGESPALASARTLRDLVGDPNEGNVLKKLEEMFFCDDGEVYLRITNEVLDEYFSQSMDKDARRTSAQILDGFLYADVHSGEDGGVFVAMSDTTEFFIERGMADLDCEISPIYYSKTIGRFGSVSGDSLVVGYASKIEEGYADMDILVICEGLLDWVNYDRVEEPRFREANYVMVLGGKYYALFGFEDGNFGRLGRIFDAENNKYGRGDLEGVYGDIYDSCEARILESFK